MVLRPAPPRPGVVLEPQPDAGEPGGWWRGAPDLAVEVLSPSDTSTAVQRKILDYLEAGSRLVWIVDPGARTVMVHRPDGTATLIRDHETLDGEDVLESCSLSLARVLPG